MTAETQTNGFDMGAYAYNAEGRRVRRKVNLVESWQIYGFDSELVAEYAHNGAVSSPQKEYGYRNGQLLVVAQASTANAVADFSTTQNPNGVWGFGYKTFSGSTLNVHSSNVNIFGAGLDSWSQGGCCPVVVRNGTGTTYNYPTAPSVTQPADVLNLHPGPNGERSVVRWTAPVAGTYMIAGRFQGIDTGGTTTDVAILHNTTSVFNSNVNGYGNQATFSVVRTVAAGETIDFQVGYGSNGNYSNDSTGLSATITPQTVGLSLQWLVADHLGTPRMIIDQTGALANVKRHDYLPFGEELYAGTGGRTIAKGYSGDNIRQKFTLKERDNETGLDYFGARYYASIQGRFTGADPYDINLERQNTSDPEEADNLFRDYIFQPQHWNRYAYALNNPLRYVDPDGRLEYETELLGKKIKVKISDNLKSEDGKQKLKGDDLKAAQEKIKGNIDSAIAKINSGQTKLSSEQITAINSMKGIEVRTDIKAPGMNTASKVFYLTQQYGGASLDALTAGIIHDSFHADQARRGVRSSGIEAEKQASAFAVPILEKLGLSNQIIERYRVDAKEGHGAWGQKSRPAKKTIP